VAVVSSIPTCSPDRSAVHVCDSLSSVNSYFSLRYMSWTKRLLLALPFGIAAVLNVLSLFVDRLHLHRQRVAEYVFLFATPWAWLLDHGWFGVVHNRWLSELLGYTLLLWIPAALYSCCIWLIFVGVNIVIARRSR